MLDWSMALSGEDTQNERKREKYKTKQFSSVQLFFWTTFSPMTNHYFYYASERTKEESNNNNNNNFCLSFVPIKFRSLQ